MTDRATGWIAMAGVRLYQQGAETTDIIPDNVLADPRLSLVAKGLYALLLTHQGEPIDPYDDAIESAGEIRGAVDELIAAGYAVRISR